MIQFSNYIRLMAVAVVAACGSVAVGETRITLRENVTMTKNLVRLGDVCEIACDDPEEARELLALPLMPAPATGGKHFLRKREIEDALTSQGVDLQTLKLDGAAQVTIVASRAADPGRQVAGRTVADRKVERRAALLAGKLESSGATEVSKENKESAAVLNEGVTALITSYLKTKSAQIGSSTVTCDVAERHLALLATATTRPVCRGGMAPWTGRQRFEISFDTAVGTTKFLVYADVKPAATPVVVALRSMARGEVVTAADVEMQEVEYVPRVNDRRVAARSVEMLIGMEVRQGIPAGGMVFMEAVQPPVLVKRGELIHISSQSGGIRVRTTARALQDRSHGQLVEVESLTTKAKFDARVIGPGEAAIVAITPPAASERAGPIETARLK